MKLHILVVALLLSACTPTGQVTQEQPVTIGGMFILSGLGSEWGEAELQGAQLALEERGTSVELVVSDIQFDQTSTVLAAQKLMTVDGAVAIVGPTWLGSFQGVAAVAEENDVVLVTPSESITALKAEQPYPNSFAVWYRTDAEASYLAEQLASGGTQKVVLIFGLDPFWTDFKEQFKRAAEKRNITVLYEQAIGGKESDFRTVLLKTQAADPDAILFGLDSEASIHTFLKQRRELDIRIPLYSTEVLEGLAQKEEFAGITQNAYAVMPAKEESAFARKYRERYGEEPVFSASTAYDSMNMLLEAIEAGNKDASSIQEYLRTHEFDTVTFGRVSFDELGGVRGGTFTVKRLG